MMIKLKNGKLFVKGESTDIFEVKIKDVGSDMFLNIELVPNEYARENEIEEEFLSVDLLNETIVDVLKENGYTIITESEIDLIQNKDW
jgi:hypothetical protein